MPIDIVKENKYQINIMKLETNKEYLIHYSGQFCHRAGAKGFKDFSPDMNPGDTIKAIFIGRITTSAGIRNVFWSDQKFEYFMFGAKKVDYIK